MTFFLYGPPASGKSTLAVKLAAASGGVPIDLDERIVQHIGMTIAEYFEKFGEAEFRKIEGRVLRETIDEASSGCRIVALGGGALLDEANRKVCEAAGRVVCLDAPSDKELERRIADGKNSRPLGNRLAERAEHYASFPYRISKFPAVILILIPVMTQFIPTHIF